MQKRSQDELRKIALKDAEDFQGETALESLDRLFPSIRQRESVRRWQQLIDPEGLKEEEDQEFEEEIPDGDTTQAEEIAEQTGGDVMEIAEETGEVSEVEDLGLQEQIEYQKNPDGSLLLNSEGQPIPMPSRPNVQEDEVFDKDLFLPISELKDLASSYAEDYGYDKGFDVIEPRREGDDPILKYKGYIPPAPSIKRTELKSILIRLYDGLIERMKQSDRSKNKESYEKSYRENLSKELAEIDGLNDLEISHALDYYKKIQMAQKRYEKKNRKPEEVEEGA